MTVSKIINGLYLSDMSITTCTIQDYKIAGILNMTPDVPSRTDVETIRIPIEDSTCAKAQHMMYSYFPIITAFIHKIRDIEKKNVLIHCLQGKQRSPTAIIAYFMKHYKMPIDKATLLVKRKHVLAFKPNNRIHFLEALRLWANDPYTCIS